MNTRRSAGAKILVGSITLLGAAALVPVHGYTASRDPKVDGANRVVVLLDGYVQTRFEQDDGRFGLERLPPPIDGHGGIVYKLPTSNDREREIIRDVNAAPYEYLVEFLHCAHVAGHPPGAKIDRQLTDRSNYLSLIAARSSVAKFEPYAFISKEREAFRKTVEAPLQKAAVAQLAKLMRGETVDTKADGWHLALRPIRASQASCLNCHTGAQGGDVFGVMVYAVRPLPKQPPTVADETKHSSL